MAAHISASKLTDLIQRANKDGRMHACIVDGRLALGTDPTNPSVAIDLSVEAIVPFRRDLPAMPPSTIRASRKSGDYWVELRGQRQEFGSLRDLLAGSLRAIEQIAPGSLEKLSQIKPRSKRIVAHDRTLLFDSPDLAEKYSVRLMNGYWFGTNNSTDETRTWLQRACNCAGLEWGSDFRSSLELTRASNLSLEELGL